jgi:hypothetical protein
MVIPAHQAELRVPCEKVIVARAATSVAGGARSPVLYFSGGNALPGYVVIPAEVVAGRFSVGRAVLLKTNMVIDKGKDYKI